jgi:hypothetical protein
MNKKTGEYYLAYAADSAQTIKLNLTGEKNYDLQIIDTWNMKIVSEKIISPGSFNYETEMPFTALRIIRTIK